METKYKHFKKNPTSPIKRLIIVAIFQTKAICILKLNLNCFRIYKFSFFKTIRYTFYNSSRYNLGNNFGNVFLLIHCKSNYVLFILMRDQHTCTFRILNKTFAQKKIDLKCMLHDLRMF